MSEQEVAFAGGKASSTNCPPYHYIPTEGLSRTATRFELGVINKGDKAWNAVSNNQEVLTDREFILSRITHGIKHLMLVRDKILAGTPMDGDDDAAAVAWTGLFLCSATKALELQFVAAEAMADLKDAIDKAKG